MSKPKPKPLPYASTTIDPDTTIIEIKKLFRKYGIQNIQDTTIEGNTTLRFMYHTENRDTTFLISPPQIRAMKKTWNPKLGRYETLNVPMIAQAWRLVYWYLEIKLKAINYGLVSLEREFLNQMLTSDSKTVGDYITEMLDRDKGILKLEEQKPQPEIQPNEPKKVDAEYKIKEPIK